MKTIRIKEEDRINIEIFYSGIKGISSWKGCFWKKINLNIKTKGLN